MKLAWIVAVAIALGADAFSLALAIGLAGIGKKMIIRLSLVIAAFHVFMPLLGLLAGQALGLFLGRVAKGMGSLLLLWLGARMLINVLRPGPEPFSFSEAKHRLAHDRLPQGISLNGFGIYAVATSVSMDALSVGFSLGTVETNIVWTVIIMGCVAGIMTFGGLVLGRFMGDWAGEKAEILGGLALFVIGIRLLLGVV